MDSAKDSKSNCWIMTRPVDLIHPNGLRSDNYNQNIIPHKLNDMIQKENHLPTASERLLHDVVNELRLLRHTNKRRIGRYTGHGELPVRRDHGAQHRRNWRWVNVCRSRKEI